MTKLLGFNFEIHYRPGLENKAAEALWRIPPTTSYSVDLDQIDSQVQQHPQLKSIIVVLLADPAAHPGFSLLQGHLFYNNRLVLPPNSSVTNLIMHEGHYSPMGGHSGILKTLKSHCCWILLCGHEN